MTFVPISQARLGPKQCLRSWLSMTMVARIVLQQSLFYGADFVIISQYFRKKYNRESFWTHYYCSIAVADWGGGIGTAVPNNFRFAKCDRDALVWFKGSNNRLRVSQLTGVRFFFLKLCRTAKKQGHCFQWRRGIALAYSQGRRSFLLFGLRCQDSMKTC